MKRLALIATTLPGMSLAHGAHAPVPEAVHGLAHVELWAALAIIAIAGVAAWAMRVRS